VKKILFVDDEPMVLNGLQRMLRPLRTQWEMTFVESGKKALEVLAATPFDVVVSDMRMPGMDGAQLLTEVKRLYPQIVRLILSGHSDKEMILRSVGPTHQYLAKPCDTETLKNTVARACALRDLLSDEPLKRLVSRMESLPSLPHLYAEIMNELQSPDSSIQKVGEIIAQDVGMTAKILQLVNSAFFGLRRHVSNPSQAASLLGLETVKALVLSSQVFSQFEEKTLTGLRLEALWSHSLAVGALARRICIQQSAPLKVTDDAFLAGLLHDAGKLVLAANVPEHYIQALTLASQRGLHPCDVERGVMGASHAEIGAYLLGLWGLPDPIVEALAYE